jgi:hypothetical protein
VGVAALAALSGCTYTSRYAPPDDGRARVVWRESGVVAHLPRTTSAAACAQAAEVAMDGEPFTAGATPVGVVWWVPVPPPVIVVEGGAGATGHVRAAPGAVPGRTAATPRVSGGATRGTSGGRTGGSGRSSWRSGSKTGGSSNGLGAAALAVAVLALVALPAITITIAATTPEDAETSSAAIDRVNAYNDVARGGDPACEGAP